MDLSDTDREFIKDLAIKVVEKHLPADANLPRAELAKDVAEAIEVCVLAKLQVPNSIEVIGRAALLWRARSTSPPSLTESLEDINEKHGASLSKLAE
jgi:hypothetical protein